jgi:hypothetical protein
MRQSVDCHSIVEIIDVRKNGDNAVADVCVELLAEHPLLRPAHSQASARWKSDIRHTFS